jgi:ABC-type multidrug transport system fused ATPase/permease subunit
MSDIDRARALPKLGFADTAPGKPEGSSDKKFKEIVRIFVRTWPFIIPLVVGYWREKTLSKATATGSGKDTDWSFYHAPFIVTIFTLIGPLTGMLPMGVDTKLDLLLAATVVMTAISWALIFMRGRILVIVSLILTAIGTLTALTAIFLVDGHADNFQVLLVCFGCVCIWLVQYRFDGGRLQVRLRLGCHLIYYYAIVYLFVLVGIVAGLFSADVINQSILQAEPLTPFLADFIGRPDLAIGTVPREQVEAERRSASGKARPQEKAAYSEKAYAGKGKTAAAKGASKDKAPSAKISYGKGKAGYVDGKGKGQYAGKGKGKEGASQSDMLLSKAQRRDLFPFYIVFYIGISLLWVPYIGVNYYHTWIMQGINQNLRNALVERWHRLSIRYHGDHRVGDSVYRIYQDSSQVTNVLGTVLKVIQTLVMYLVTLAFIAALDPILGGLSLAIAVAAMLWGNWFSPRMREHALVARERNAALTSRIQEIFEGIRVIKASGTEDSEQKRFEADSVTAFNAAHRIRFLVAIVTIVMFTLAAALLLGGEFFMAVWASMGRPTFAATLIGLIGLSYVVWNLAAYQWASGEMATASWQIQGLLRMWATAQDMAMGLDRVFNILDIEPDVVDAPDAIPMPPFRKEIRFDSVRFGYDPDQPVLRGISFSAKPGSITAIVGPTGSGKSTLMSLLPRLFDPDAGSVEIDGVDLRRFEVDSLRGNVSVALQENVLFGVSVRDNIRYVVPDADDQQVLEAARVACVDDYISGLPDGLDTILSDRGGKLSSGQRQRLNIARAIIKDTPILVLDEPTAALDAGTELRVLERLAEWAEKRAIFLITHRISTISRADQILYIDDGKIVESGSHEELMQVDGGRYRRFVETEAVLSKRSAINGNAAASGKEDADV